MNNSKVKITKTELLSDNWYALRKITYDYQKKMALGKSKKEKLMIGGMGQLFYCMCQNKT